MSCPSPRSGPSARSFLAWPQGRAATLANAIAGAGAFGVGPEQASQEVADLAGRVRARWAAVYEGAGVSKADRDRFATCFRQADPTITT
jgi:serine/threonine-protein kinase HipA